MGNEHGHHDHEHADFEKRAEARPAPSGLGTVMLDIGDGVGALVVHASAALNGIEIEIARRGETRAFVHTEVRERRLPEATVYAGVFPDLPAGDYTLLDVAAVPDRDLTIRSGRVTEVSVPG